MNEPMQIVDVSARDGLQNEANADILSAQDKVDYIQLLMAAGLKRIEAGSFVKPSAVPAMANSAEVAELLAPLQAKHPEISFSYLVPNLQGLERAKSVGVKEVAVFLAVSEMFSRANINQSVDDAFTNIAPVITQALANGMQVRGYLSNMFGYKDLPFVPELVATRTNRLLAMGCYEVSLGDTTGIGRPEQIEPLLHAMNEQYVPMAQIAMHFHDTFGAAMDNVKQSYALGVRTFDASTGGLGGCPYADSPKGNLSMQDLVHWCVEQGITTDVVDSEALQQADKWMKEKLNKSI